MICGCSARCGPAELVITEGRINIHVHQSILRDDGSPADAHTVQYVGGGTAGH